MSNWKLNDGESKRMIEKMKCPDFILSIFSEIFEMKNKTDFINKVADLICLIRRSFIEHLTNIHPRTFVKVKLL